MKALLRVTCLSALFSSLLATALAQNLVPNGDFETLKVNPLSGNLNNIYTPVNLPSNGGQYDELGSWHSTNVNNPDYYNYNTTRNAAGLSNTDPAQSIHGPFTPNGNGAIGLLGVYDWQVTRPAGLNVSDYVFQELPQALNPNRYYYASMRVIGGSQVEYETPIGMYITTGDPRNYLYTNVYDNTYGSVDYGTTYTIPSAATGVGIRSAARIGPSQWIQISDVFKGLAGAKYLNIGNFEPTNYQSVRPNALLRDISYTYVDDVELYEIPDAGDNPPVCSGNVTIGRGNTIPGATYAWTVSGNPTPFAATVQTQVNPFITTVYILTVTLPNQVQRTSSVTVTVDPPVAGNNQTICANTAAVIGQGCTNAGTYAWRIQGSSTVFATGLQISVTPTITTTYELTVTQSNGTVATSQVTVTVFDANNLTPQVSLSLEDDCYGQYVYYITNYNPAYTYTVQVFSGFSGATGVNPGLRGGRGTFELTRAKKAQSGSFAVTASYTGCGGGSATSPTITRSFPIFPACRQAASTADTNDSTTDNSLDAAMAYPNPASETLIIPQSVEQAILFNSQGGVVQQTEGISKLDISSLPSGLYNLRMRQKGKIINQHIEVKH